MESFFRAVASMAVVLGVMILVHEFGHYAAAKFFGVRVDVFSIGFGKRLFGFKRGVTDYRISALPLGGYVKMAGENPLESRTGAPDEFMSHSRWQRFVIAVAGPVMNILLAIFLLTVVFMVHYERPEFFDQPAVIGWVLDDSPAAHAGVEQGDRIVRVDGVHNPTWEDVMLKVLISPNQAISMTIERGNTFLEKSVKPDVQGNDEYGSIGLEPEQTVSIAELTPDMPAINSGLQVNDRILALNGTPIRSRMAIRNYLQHNGGKPVELSVLRNGQELHFSMTPVEKEQGGQNGYWLGFVMAAPPNAVEKLPFDKALKMSLQENKRYSLLIVELVQKMLEHKVSIKQMEGPIGIARASGEASSQPGWTPLLQLMAMISLNLGIFNLLPIPILDGGMILMLIIESLIRRDINIRVKERIYQTAFVFLILFAVVVIYNDIMKALPGLAQRLP
jgi:regulator of sigma E protease